MSATSAMKPATAPGNAKQKENLNWKINYLAAQLGDKSRIPRANLAAKALAKEKESIKDEEDSIRQQLLGLKAEKINKKLYHTFKEIKKLLKKSKALEVQKISKKTKEVRKLQESDQDNKKHQDTLEKLDQEASALRTLDLDQIATSATRNKINKLGSVKHSEISSLLSFTTDESGKSKDNSLAQPEKSKILRDLETRLLNFKPIREEFAKVVKDVDATLQAGSGSQAAIETNVKEVEELNQGGDDNDHDTADEADDEDIEMKEEEDSTGDQVDTSKRKRGSAAGDASQPKKKTKPKKESVKAKAAESTFVGTLYSGSGDDDEEEQEEKVSKKKQKKSKSDDWVDDKFDEIYGAPKKNRPGQRARREKWEKLYGEEAKHVKSELEAQKAREERKLARQLKKSASGGNKAPLGKKRTNASEPGKKTESVPEQLHPSWEAKKQQQDLMAKALSGAGGLGNKKIVFEDSD
ncbi:hypothetical protein INT43_004128 [Umbelopsis isabellina]|uniref:Bud22 domain-containing protein n=1 Tax=Mortierella isabellina TaxID=91625 RepID=A0A8H7PHL7_MORIS|nr:hypothetical protein INT43_004128 [Umbelopsis isabellina]